MDELNKENYSDAGVTSSSGMASQLGSPSAEVILTDGVAGKTKKKLKKFDFEDSKGLITTINGKKLKLTGLTDKERIDLEREKIESGIYSVNEIRISNGLDPFDGDEFDIVIEHAKWLSHLGSWAYDFSIYFNILINRFRRYLNKPSWSLSAWLKYKVKSAVSFIGNYEDTLSSYAKSLSVHGIVCGHIHHPNIRDIKGITYINCGDWVETCSAVVEHENGNMEIIYWD